MTIKQLLFELEKWIPTQIAWSKDNVGIQVGEVESKIQNILLALDLNLEIIEEAKSKSANLIIIHHPLFFNPARSITSNTLQGKLTIELLKNNISCYAAHTNLDSVNGGVNTTLANLLGLKEIKILAPLQDSLCKFIVFVPEKNVEQVAEAIHSVGGGMFLKYDKCSFRTKGTGTFRGSSDSKPAIGKPMKLEYAKEIKIEILTEQWKISEIIKAVRENHPYEEIAYDIISLNNTHRNFGLGAYGSLKKKMKSIEFLKFVKNKLKVSAIRYSGNISSVSKVAVCGGSGSKYLLNAIQKGADAFITSDISYHTFQEYSEKILLIDAGHYETEHHVLPSLQKNLEKIIYNHKGTSKVHISHKMKNPASYL